MKFGPVPSDSAAGAILAHSVPLPKGRLRKGILIGAEEIAALTAAGIAEVTVARLEPGDIGEDAAAARLAEAVQGAGQIAPGAAQTGRVNLVATGAGVLQIDIGAVEALNAVDPGITLATLPDLSRVQAGALIATVKIIPYAVPAAALAQAESLGAGALQLRAPVLRRACLIETLVPGQSPGKGREAIAARLAALGVALDPPVIIPHDSAALAQSLGAARAGGADLMLILTGSATSDIGDVAPRGLIQAGGRMIRFGLPVDPGNLLFLGALEDCAVIGLPGCARSPALNGADWVLERVICGIPPSAADMGRMGVGGLLKEIPSRPSPRRGSS